MNERIKQLAEQANIHFSRVGILDGDPNGSARMVGYSKMELFAELIVYECGVALSPMLRDMVSRGQAFDLIKKHFGEEE